MGRRILNRKEMRADFDAAERTKGEEEQDEEEEEGDDDEDEEEGDDEESSEEEDGEEAAGDEGEEGDEDDEDAPKKKKKKKKAVKPPKPPKVVKPKRTRTPKVVRMRVVWGVFNNSNQCVATYEYPRKQEAEQHVARLIADKRSTHFLQPVKEPIEEKKEKEK